MTTKNKVDLKKVAVVTVVLILAIVLILAMVNIFKQFNGSSAENDLGKDAEISTVGNQTKPEETENKDSLQVDLVDYTVYNLSDLDFQFVIARVRVKAETAINIDLSHFTTSEGIVLNEVNEYVSKLESKALFLGKQNVWFEIVSQDTSVLSNIFIPVKDKKAETITVTSDLGGTAEFSFNLKNPKGTQELLSYKPDDVITDGRTYQMKVSNAFMMTGDTITRTYSDGYSEEYMVPSTAQVHAFKVEAVSLWGDELVIESAIYTVTATKEEFIAFNEQFSTMKYENLLNKTITDTSSGVLFFETLNPTENPITYKGILRLKIKGQDNYIVINVDL